jgi:hypothetical protein
MIGLFANQGTKMSGLDVAEGCAASLRQQAKWIREALDPATPEYMRVDLGDIDIEELEAAANEIERLRKGIQDYLDGNYANPRDGRADGPQTRCPHGMFYWDTCENCIDEHFAKLLNP